MGEVEWKPPFCAHEAEDVACPKCGEETVYARECETYFDSDDVEAFCSSCHASLTVCVSVTIEFFDAEVSDGR